MVREFTWRPDVLTAQQVAHRVLSVQFGDGYEQIAGDGINTRREAWELTFTKNGAVIDQVKAFIDEHGGYMPFEWVNSDGVRKRYRASGYSEARQSSSGGSNVKVLTVTFTEVF